MSARHLLNFILPLTLCVIALGAYTRLADAGLGCPDWPGCYGHLWLPLSEEQQASANARWSDNPVNLSLAVIEVVHRMAAGVLGLLVLVLALLFWPKLRERRGEEFKTALLVWIALGLVIVQALFGMWTVTLKLLPQIVSAHLMGGFALFSLLYWCSLRIHHGPAPAVLSTLPRLALLDGLLLLIVQIALGAWLSANYAAIACPDFPQCQGEWLPPMDFGAAFNVAQSVGPNYLGGTMDNSARVAIHFTHRVVALGLFVYLFGLGLMLLAKQSDRSSPLSVSLYAMLALLLIQCLLGIANVLFHFPLLLALAHTLVAALLLLSMLRTIYFS